MIDLRPFTRRTFIAASTLTVAQGAWASRAPEFIAAYERETRGLVGVFAMDLASGRQLAWRAHERFAMCSTFKASLAGFALSRVDAGRESLGRAVAFRPQDMLEYAPFAKTRLESGEMTIGEMCKAVVELSDNTCANLLLRELGGPAALTRFWRSLGDGSSRLDHDEPLLNRTKPGNPHDTTTPAAMAHTLRELTVGDALTTASSDRLIEWMVASKTGAKKLRAGLPRDWRTGDRTGSNGADAAGNIAMTWPARGGPIVITAYVQGGQPKAVEQDSLFAQIGRLVAERLG